jgi:hypothetical protein
MFISNPDQIRIRPKSFGSLRIRIRNTEIASEEVVVLERQVPVTQHLSANVAGFLPVHCMHQLLKSRVFSKHRVSIKSWIYNQVSDKILKIFDRLFFSVKEAVRNMVFHLCDWELNFAFRTICLLKKSQNRCSRYYIVSFSVADPDVYPGSEIFNPWSRVKKAPNPASRPQQKI